MFQNWKIIIGLVLGVFSIAFGFIPPLTNYSYVAFLGSIFTFFYDQYTRTMKALDSTDEYSGRMSSDVKDRLHVVRLQEPMDTFKSYVVDRLSVIKSIKNTSFNIYDDHEEADENFNHSPELKKSIPKIAKEIDSGLVWRDIGDKLAKTRFSEMRKAVSQKNDNQNVGEYSSKIVNNQVPYPNFLIITYKDNRKEVLFNWDFRSRGIAPNVLVSSEKELVNFYNAQFELLSKNSVTDTDELR